MNSVQGLLLNSWPRFPDEISDFGACEAKWLLHDIFPAIFITLFFLLEGIKSSGKVVYVTATFPYVVLIILLIRYTIYYLLSTIYFLLSTIYYLLSTIYYLLSTIYYLLSTIYYLLSTIYYLLSTIYNLLSTIICYLLLSDIYYLSTILSTIICYLSIYYLLLSAIYYLLSIAGPRKLTLSVISEFQNLLYLLPFNIHWTWTF